MATDLRAIPGTEVTQTRFAGGKERGVCIQLTGIQQNTFQQLQFTREQARMVAQELLLFANGMEVTDAEDRPLSLTPRIQEWS
tara:strand:- start:225 stop:473 length:249 start_codon:yes stop_codon:yes gene_type:complete